MKAHLNMAKNADQQAAKGGIAVLTDAWPESFRQLLDRVAAGKVLPQAPLDEISADADQLALEQIIFEAAK